MHKEEIKDLLSFFIDNVSEKLSLDIDKQILKYMIDDFINKEIKPPLIHDFEEKGYFVLFIKNKISVMPVLAEIQAVLVYEEETLKKTTCGWMGNAPEAFVEPFLQEAHNKMNDSIKDMNEVEH